MSLFVPDISKPILLIYGSKGAAKTTTFEMIKNIIDPSVVETLLFPKETNDLILILSHNCVALIIFLPFPIIYQICFADL